MPHNNRFRHQTYQFDQVRTLPQRLQPPRPPSADAAEFTPRLSQVGQTLRKAGVERLYLVHGTHVGDDPFGLIRPLAWFSPNLSHQLRGWQLGIVDHVVKDAGNYPAEFIRELERGLGEPGTRPSVHRFVWTSENNHIGRADAAIRLIAELLAAGIEPGKRVLLWGHSHGGNVFALITNLLAADVETRTAFFDAARPFFESVCCGYGADPIWEETRQQLLKPGNPLGQIHLDFVTFGTPVRYGWDSGGYAKLLHVIHHRPAPGLDPCRVPFPPSWEDFTTAARGDVVQQLAVAGTNTAPGLLHWKTWLADRRLHALLQHGIDRRTVISRLADGFRLPDEGETLLVDYGPIEGSVFQHVFGHAVYTKLEWLLFHAEETTRRLYPDCFPDTSQA